VREIGLLCGTFNPIHWGHLLLAEWTRSQFNLEKVIFVTSGTPPHRHQDLLDKETRHLLVETAIASNPLFEACRMELDRPGPSYTADTIMQLHDEIGSQCRLNLLVGGDNIPHISSWHKSAEIFKRCRLLVAPRATGSVAPTVELQDVESEAINFPQIEISSSSIRQRLRQGQSVLYMVPPEVNQILLKHGYYLQAESGQFS